MSVRRLCLPDRLRTFFLQHAHVLRFRMWYQRDTRSERLLKAHGSANFCHPDNSFPIRGRMHQNRRGVDDDLVCERAHSLAMPGLAVIGTDNDGMIVCWDSEATRLYGALESEVLGRNLNQVTVAPSSLAEAEQVMEGLRRGECSSGTFLMKRKGGEPFVAHMQCEPVINEEGTLVGFVEVSSAAE